MATTILHGKQGKVTFAGANTVANVIAWSANVTCDVAESTVMDQTTVAATTHWKEYKAGFLDWTATVECDLDDGGLDPDLDADFSQDPDGLALVLESTSATATGRKYTGNGIITDISITTDRNDIVKLTYTVQGSGALLEEAVA